MSTVRLHLPFFDGVILSKIINLINEIKNIYIINVDEIKIKDQTEMYEFICKKIFENYAMKIIILGDYTKICLPISDNGKIIIKELANKSIKKYDKLNYKIYEKKKLIDRLEQIIHTYDTHIFTIDKFNGDVYKLWYLTQNIDYETVSLSDFIKSAFKKISIDKFKFWDKILIDDIKEYPNEYQRMKNSDLSYPIIVLRNKKDLTILDGFHRLIKAYRYEYKNIKVKYVTNSLVNKTIVNEKDLDKNLSLIVKM